MKAGVGFSTSGNLHLALSRLQEDGEEALVALARSVAKGEPLVRCQLLASIFYEELRRQLRQCPRMDNPEWAVLVTAADYCGRAAIMRPLQWICCATCETLWLRYPTTPHRRRGSGQCCASSKAGFPDLIPLP